MLGNVELAYINLKLVKHGARKGYITESEASDNLQSVVVALAKEMSLFIHELNTGILVTREELREELTADEIREAEGCLHKPCDVYGDKIDRFVIEFFIDGMVAKHELCPMGTYTRAEVDDYRKKTEKTWRAALKDMGMEKRVHSTVIESIGTPIRMAHLKRKDAKYVFENKFEYIDDLWNFTEMGLFQLMLHGSQDESEVLLFIEPLTTFYQHAVMDKSLKIPEGVNETDWVLKKEKLALFGQLNSEN